MQNSNPSHNASSAPMPLSLDDALARAAERAVQRMRSGALGLGELFAAFAARSDVDPDEPTRPHGVVSPTEPAGAHASNDEDPPADHAGPDAAAHVTLDELLSVFREPIAWALDRAERHAQGDPVDLAALGRVGAAIERRITWIHSGGLLGEARPRFRATDLLTVAGLVAGSLAPDFAAGSSGGIRATFLDALARLIPLGAAYAPRIPRAPRSTAPLEYVETLLGVALPLGASRPAYPAMPICCCRHGHL